ncbi:MAG: GDSL-type esterase/lipase family protein [Hyphomicrobiaceae bacterium]|jgi:acyl-CoA thioesterase-1
MEAATIKRLTTAAGAALVFSAALSFAVWAQATTGQGDTDFPPLAKECGEASTSVMALPNSARALANTKKLKILAIGASSASILGGMREGSPPLLEQLLERTVAGLDVEIVNRGVSGELAGDAAKRLKVEVALNQPDVVLWQVGTNDAFAQVPVEEFQETVGEMVRWLKEHNTDVILVGLHYMKNLAKDPHYQAMRASLQHIANTENVPRIGRYEAMEILARTLRENGRRDPGEFGSTESAYDCMARYVARVIAVGLFAKAPKKPAGH